MPSIVLADIQYQINLELSSSMQEGVATSGNTLDFTINGSLKQIQFEDGVGSFDYVFSSKDESISIAHAHFYYVKNINPIPLWMSVFPPLIAIIMALVFKEVITSLFVGISIGGMTIGLYQYGILGLFSGILSVIDKYIINALNSWDHLAVIIFSMIIGAIVSIISKNGGRIGVVEKISRYAKDSRSGQLVTWALGVLIFFDDYANTLVVGNTMRPMTDRLKISREKLSYIVDSTAAPVAAIAFVTTWIGFELGYIEDSAQSIGIQESAYSIFLNSLQYSFYPILTLIFMVMLILSEREFGTMYKAELRAKTTGQVIPLASSQHEPSEDGHGELDSFEPAENIPHRWYNAVIPIAIIILGTVVGLGYTGYTSITWPLEEIGFSRKLSMIIGASDPYSSLLWSSLVSLLVAIFLSVSQKLLSLTGAIDAMMKGYKAMFTAIIILILAWALAIVTEDLHTADFITQSFISGGIHPVLIPAVTFVLASLIAFSTGSSWGSMAILYPIMLPAGWLVCSQSGMDPESSMMIFYNVVSCVLAGSVLGDHCSPISDTTILSSLATSCNHIEHVRTQLPYALTVGITAILVGTLPAALGVSSLITFPLGILVLFLIIRFFGKKVS